MLPRIAVSAICIAATCTGYSLGIPPPVAFDARAWDPRAGPSWQAYLSSFYPLGSRSHFAPYDLPGPAGALARHYARGGLAGRGPALAMALHGIRGGIGPLGEIHGAGAAVRAAMAPLGPGAHIYSPTPFDAVEDAEWYAQRGAALVDPADPYRPYGWRLGPYGPYGEYGPYGAYGVLNPRNAALMRYGAAAAYRDRAMQLPAYVGELLPKGQPAATPKPQTGGVRRASAAAALLAGGSKKVQAVALPGASVPSGSKHVLLYNAPPGADLDSAPPHWTLRALDNRVAVSSAYDAVHRDPLGPPVLVRHSALSHVAPGSEVHLSAAEVHPPLLPIVY